MRFLSALGTLSVVLLAIGCSREPPAPPISKGATVAALTPCPDAQPGRDLLWGRLAVPDALNCQTGVKKAT
jgi:hypothetical protein